MIWLRVAAVTFAYYGVDSMPRLVANTIRVGDKIKAQPRVTSGEHSYVEHSREGSSDEWHDSLLIEDQNGVVTEYGATEADNIEARRLYSEITTGQRATVPPPPTYDSEESSDGAPSDEIDHRNQVWERQQAEKELIARRNAIRQRRRERYAGEVLPIRLFMHGGDMFIDLLDKLGLFWVLDKIFTRFGWVMENKYVEFMMHFALFMLDGLFTLLCLAWDKLDESTQWRFAVGDWSRDLGRQAWETAQVAAFNTWNNIFAILHSIQFNLQMVIFIATLSYLSSIESLYHTAERGGSRGFALIAGLILVQILALYGVLYSFFIAGEGISVMQVAPAMLGAGSVATLVAVGFDGKPLTVGSFHVGIIAAVLTIIRLIAAAPIITVAFIACLCHYGVPSIDSAVEKLASKFTPGTYKGRSLHGD